MKRIAAAIAWTVCGAAHACGNAGDKVVAGAQYEVAFRTSPAPIRIGEHFVVDLTVCPIGKAPAPRKVRVDATMPEHRHGMNYRPAVVARGAGRYRAEGMLFHMSGRWVFAFDIETGRGTERITSAVELS